MLHPSVRVIQGDGVNHDSIYDILATLKRNGWSADNVAFGMGGAPLQHANRDTFSFAMKCSAIRKDGFWQDVQKDPATDTRKKSKAGRISLYKVGSEFVTAKTEGAPKDVEELLRTVFANGRVLTTYSLDAVRANAATTL